jgi:hypothetical protein
MVEEQREVPVVEESEPKIVYVGRGKAYAKRAGCGAAVLLWMVVLLIPAFLFLLAIQGEVALWHSGDVPEGESHPLLQVKLLMEVETRGLNITSSNVVRQDDLTCMQTSVRYLLWQGEGNNVSYCDCYTRESNESAWELVTTNEGSCAP